MTMQKKKYEGKEKKGIEISFAFVVISDRANTLKSLLFHHV